MEEEIRALRSELALLKLQFSERIGEVESRLNTLLIQQTRATSVATEKHEKHEKHEQHIIENVADSEQSNTATSTIDTPRHNSIRKEKSVEKAKPSIFILFITSLLSNIFDWFSPVVNVYQSYKERGMLGTLLLTLAGIGLTLAGFGYLMQLLIDQLGSGTKAMLMCFAAILVIALGIGLKIKTRFDEFAAAIVTLGILLCYNTIYFSGSVYQLLPVYLVLFSYLLVALLCHVLALLLETKVVAALGIIGIATMPILSNTTQIEPTYYLLSLALVTASSLILALKRVGQWLAHLALAFTLVSIEWVLAANSTVISVWILEVFYLLFFVYIFALFYRANEATTQALIFLAATIGASVLMFYQAAEIQTAQMSISFVINMAMAALAAIALYRVNRQAATFIVLASAIWGVLAIVSLVSNAYWGVAWAAEGLLLILIGRKYLLTAVVNQGQCLTGGAIIFSFIALGAHFPLPALKSFDGWLLSLFIVVAVALWQRVINASKAFSQLTQNGVKSLLRLIEVVWLAVLVISSLHIWLAQWTGSIVILIQLAILWRAKYCKQTSIEIFAALLIIVPIYYVIQGGQLVGSFYFMQLPLFAKLSILSILAQLWLWSEFYRRYQPQSQLSQVAETARVVFYLLIPVCWLASGVRHLSLNVLTVLWLSPLLAMLLAKKTAHQLVELECKILTVLSSIALVVLVGQLSALYSFVALVGFIGYYGFAYKLHQKASKPLYAFICTSGFVSLGLALPMYIILLSNEPFLGMLVAIMYWGTSLSFCHFSCHLKSNETIIVAANLLLVVSSWSLLSFGLEYAVIAIIFIAISLYQKEHRIMKTVFGRALKSHADLFFHSVFSITYVLSLLQLSAIHFDLLIAPALAIHGAVILFLKDKRLTTVKYSFVLIGLGVLKLAFVDAASALLWQKVILFMGIGGFILTASFWYQKLVKQTTYNNQNEELPS